MRLISRKIWRAFPELDAYDDVTCQRYLARARFSQSTGLHVALICVVAVAAFVCVLGTASPHYHGLVWFTTRMTGNDKIGPYTEVLLNLLVFVSLIWAPWLAGAVTRDKLLELSIKRHLNGAICPECRYSLVGLEVSGSEENRCVRCPECGREMALRYMDLTEADINPNLLNKV